MIGARLDGQNEVVAVEDGYHGSSESWATLLRDPKHRSMAAPLALVRARPKREIKGEERKGMAA